MAWILTWNEREGPREHKRGRRKRKERRGRAEGEGWEMRGRGRGEKGGRWREKREGGQSVCLHGTLAQE